MERSTVSDLLLLLGATMRLTRLITSDDLGRWWVKDPLDAWVHGHSADGVDQVVQERAERLASGETTVSELEEEVMQEVLAQPRLRWHRYLAGLECPWCIGFWIGAGVLTSYVATGRSRRARAAWRFVAGTLALNTAVVTIGRELDYWEE